MANKLDQIIERLERIETVLLPSDNERVDMERSVLNMLTAMAEGRKIEAIKILRSLARIGLKDAKDFICNAMDK